MHVIACIEDPGVMPKALAALAGQALKKILEHLKQKGEIQETVKLPESRGAATTRLIWLGVCAAEHLRAPFSVS
jgi:hypothetical protein